MNYDRPIQILCHHIEWLKELGDNEEAIDEFSSAIALLSKHSENKVSQFVDEIPEDCLTKVDASEYGEDDIPY